MIKNKIDEIVKCINKVENCQHLSKDEAKFAFLNILNEDSKISNFY